MRIDIHDWHMACEGITFRARPSARSVARQLWVTLLASVLIGLIAWIVGIPPGSRQLQRRQSQVEKLERDAQQLQQQADRLAGSAAGRNPRSVSAAMREQSLARAAELRARAEREKASLAGQTPTLGLAGDAACWSAIILLTLLGVGLPLLAPLARMTMTYEGPPGRGALLVRQWFLIARQRRIEATEFSRLGIHVQRLATRTRRTGLRDHGWVWQVLLFDADRSDRPPVLQCLVEHGTTLPPDRGMVTPRVRTLVLYLEAVTTLNASPPVVTDIINAVPTWAGTRWTKRSRRVEAENS